MHKMWLMYLVTWTFLFGCTFARGSSTGKEFVTGFLGTPGSIFLLDIVSSTNGEVEIYVPYLGLNQTYSFNRTFSTNISSSLQLFGTQIGHTGVYIKSTVDVSVYVTTGGIGFFEDTLICLPVQTLGNTYYISSYTPNYRSTYPSQFMVISPFANTQVNISFPNGTSISKTLNSLDVYQEAAPSDDLTGTLVQSSKPVAVVSGASCSYVIQEYINIVGCDMVSEQMIPTNAFQRNFIVPPILSNQFTVRIFSSNERSNTVCVKDVSFENCTTVGSKQWFESAPKRSSLVVTSQEPIAVIQYKESDTYMTIVPSIQQFMNLYTFVVPECFTNHNNYISVIIFSSASQTLRLDGKLISGQLVDTAHVLPPFNNYTVLTFRITTGYHVMTSTEAHVTFGLIVFGKATYGAYGYPAGINFDVDECDSNPCLHSSTCSNGVNGYTCTCSAGFSGRSCGTDNDECASTPCLHGGSCSDGVNTYTCTCPAGLSGMKCETNLDDCASSPCLYGGSCSDGVNTYTCVCPAGFSGRKCETNLDECASSPCLHGGTCSDGVNAYTCTCSAGFSGKNCQTNINECASTPCLHGGTCSDGVNAYTCTCKAGFSGRKCETNIDECSSSPCLHGCTCSDGVNAYTCTCPAGFSGRKCETNSNKQLMCYSCEDMSDLALCDTVQKCGDGELCTVIYSHSKYSSGCASSSVCSSAQTAHGHCSECCDENYCNGRGCGDSGLGTRSERGPICFDCNHVYRIDQCQTVRPCYKDEVCSIEEFDWIGHSNYKIGCVSATCTSIDHGRSVPRCKSCCSEDFCNTNCTVRETASIIG